MARLEPLDETAVRRPGAGPDRSGRRSELSSAKRALLEAWSGGRAGAEGEPRGWRSDGGPPIASFQQERHWFLELLEPGTAVQHIVACHRVSGPLDHAALEASIARIVDRHAILRTGFVAERGRPTPRGAPSLSISLPLVDLQGLPAAEREPEALRRAARRVAQSFNLAEPPLFRSLLFRLAPDAHVLLVWMHHVVGDGWSMGLCLRELGALYRAFAAGQRPELPAPSLQYADYAHRQRDGLQGDVLERLLAYWRRQLGGELPPLELPTDRPRPLRQTYRGATHRFRLAPDLVTSLKRLCRREDASLFMGLLAAFQALLHRFGGQDDILVGTPIAGRTRPELGQLVGPLLNLLVLRTDLGGEPGFGMLLRRVREVALAAYAHQELPFEKLVEALQPRRDLSRTPLFQAMLVLRNYPLPTFDVPGLTVEPLVVEKQTAEFDLSLYLEEVGGRLEAAFEYSTDLFDPPTIAQLAAAFERLLVAAVADPALPISRPELLGPADRRRVLVDWNATAADYPRDRGAHELIAEQAARTPDALALVSDSERLSYRQLMERAALVADTLQRQGVGPGVVVGLYLRRTPWLMAGLLGVLEAGGAYLPLDPADPPARVRFMLEDAGVEVVLADEGVVPPVPADVEVLQLGDGFPGSAGGFARSGAQRRSSRPLRDQAGEDARAPRPSPSDLAYVIYTSGSTGRPKGVEVEHRALANFLWAMRERPGLSADDVLLAITPITFDIAALELLLPLVVGGRVVLADRPTATDPRRLAGAIAEHRATVLQATPATWRLLLEAGWGGAPGLTALCGGERLPRELAERLLGRVGRLWNLYGPTETTIWATVGEVASGAGPVPIGQPIANTRVYVLDAHLQPVPPGAIGELHIGGDGLARGYRGRPELTAERFVADPFSPDPQARLYRTGDLARYRFDGSLELLGRVDDQLKLHGHRIEPGEIETTLRLHPGVRDAAVVARQDGSGDARLVAYVVPDGEAVPAADELRSFVRTRLPGWMVPADFVPLAALPLTSSGKLDRRSLPAPGTARAVPGEAFVPPRTPLEALLAGICGQVLEVERVGVHDNFFDLGGASIQVLEVVARCEQAGLPLVVEHLFAYQTIAELAEALEAGEAGDG